MSEESNEIELLEEPENVKLSVEMYGDTLYPGAIPQNYISTLIRHIPTGRFMKINTFIVGEQPEENVITSWDSLGHNQRKGVIQWVKDLESKKDD